jgi:hypothetical protein
MKYNAYKNYMSIAVSVLTTSRVARNNGGAARMESNPQSTMLINVIVICNYCCLLANYH